MNPIQPASVQTFHRGIARLSSPSVQPGMNHTHRARELIRPGDWAAIDPFILMMEDWFPRGVFELHPHRGLETVTFIIDGQLDHQDSHGNQGSIRPGDAQWMTAGSGIIHNEVPAADSVVHSLQLWVNLPAASKMVPPRYQDLTADKVPVRHEPGVEIRVYSGASNEVQSGTMNYTPVKMLLIRMAPGTTLTETIPADYNGFVYVMKGALEAGADQAQRVAANQLGWLTRDAAHHSSDVRLKAGDEPTELLLVAGQPLHEPVVARGPFVMNTPEQISDAYRDYREGRFATE
ncbi:pirin family protein [Paraburkholderia bonniea]|uniref:pirin family protein n=1 Tax=Paraburkholderia bonniea TaxID=2152891 RepID=UPI0012920AEB|nr:pirin family protein [Paraburkholderia bonniea]WJF90307.1 pirin family protein [Paraburkholderia bonniea]WJF93622.1 pirin family protein [Paraburkholderia bonniea]